MKPLRIYLAGKISKYDWRTTIVDGRATPCGIDVGAYADYVNEDTRYPKSWEPYEQSIHGVHTYTGPYFLRCDHGCYHGENEHGSGIESYGCGSGSSTFASDHEAQAALPHRRDHIVHLCLSAIDASDVVFAWIENTTCYGTLAEIGYAHGVGKSIWIAGPSRLPDLWFTYQLAHQVLFSPTFTPKEAFNLCLFATQSRGESRMAYQRRLVERQICMRWIDVQTWRSTASEAGA